MADKSIDRIIAVMKAAPGGERIDFSLFEGALLRARGLSRQHPDRQPSSEIVLSIA